MQSGVERRMRIMDNKNNYIYTLLIATIILIPVCFFMNIIEANITKELINGNYETLVILYVFGFLLLLFFLYVFHISHKDNNNH